MSIWTKIKPFDTLFFRTARPFSMGMDSWAEVVFPPYPSTIYGAIRSFLIFRKGKLSDFLQKKLEDEAVGTPDEKGTLRLKGPFILINNKPIFKTPMDLVKIKGKGKAKPLERIKKPSFVVSNYELSDILVWKGKEEAESADGWLSYDDFKSYIKGDGEEYSLLNRDKLLSEEPKIGIKRNRFTLTSEEGMLYRVNMIRLNENVSIGVEIDGANEFPENGVIQLGGEGKGVFFEKIEDPLKELKDIEFKFKNGIFKLYLATPAIFEKGWIPKWIDENFEGEKDGVKVKLIACAIERHVPIGGWDLAKNKEKPLRKAIPAGSVYYFQIKGNSTPEKIKEVFHLKSISEFNSEEGFGLSILGETKVGG